MPYICKNCPKENQQFRQTGTIVYTEKTSYDSTRYLNAQGETDHSEDGDVIDSYDQEHYDDNYDGIVECSNCDREAEYVQQTEYRDWLNNNKNNRLAQLDQKLSTKNIRKVKK